MQDGTTLVDFTKGLPKTITARVQGPEATLVDIDGVKLNRKATAYLAVGYSRVANVYEVYSNKAFRIITSSVDFTTLAKAAEYHEAVKKQALFHKGRWRMDIAALFDVSKKQGSEEETLTKELVGVPLYAECMDSVLFEDVEHEANAYTGLAIRGGWLRFPSTELKVRIMPSSCCYVAFVK